MNMIEKLDLCIRVETACSQIYRRFAEVFPDEREFWEMLENAEENHIDILTIAKGFHDVDYLPELMTPSDMPLMQKSVEAAESARDNIRPGMDIADALKTALMLEESVVEAYLSDVMQGNINSDAINYMRRFWKDSKTHADMIREKMDQLGIS